MPLLFLYIKRSNFYVEKKSSKIGQNKDLRLPPSKIFSSVEEFTLLNHFLKTFFSKWINSSQKLRIFCRKERKYTFKIFIFAKCIKSAVLAWNWGKKTRSNELNSKIQTKIGLFKNFVFKNLSNFWRFWIFKSNCFYHFWFAIKKIFFLPMKSYFCI